MKRLTILLFLGLSLFSFGTANANFIGLYNYPITVQKTPQATLFSFNNVGFLKYKGNEWQDLTRKRCIRNCSDNTVPDGIGSAAVPEPSTMLLTLLGVVGLGISRRKKL
jgi:hypothetical protein